MEDWAKFAKTLGMAQYGDEVRAHQDKRRKERIDEEELGFRRDANARAGAAEGRAADEHNFEKGRRGSKSESDRLALAAALFKLEDMPVQAQYAAEDQQFQREGNKRADKQLGLTQQNLALQLARQAQADADRKKGQDRADQDQKIQLGKQQSTFDEHNDPSAPKRERAEQLMKIIEGSGDGERVQAAKAELAKLKSDFERDQVVSGIKRDQVSR